MKPGGVTAELMLNFKALGLPLAPSLGRRTSVCYCGEEAGRTDPPREPVTGGDRPQSRGCRRLPAAEPGLHSGDSC